MQKRPASKYGIKVALTIIDLILDNGEEYLYTEPLFFKLRNFYCAFIDVFNTTAIGFIEFIYHLYPPLFYYNFSFKTFAAIGMYTCKEELLLTKQLNSNPLEITTCTRLMKFSIIRFTKGLLYIILLPVVLIIALVVVGSIVLFEKFFSGKKASSKPTYYKLTSWEEDPEYDTNNDE